MNDRRVLALASVRSLATTYQGMTWPKISGLVLLLASLTAILRESYLEAFWYSLMTIWFVAVAVQTKDAGDSLLTLADTLEQTFKCYDSLDELYAARSELEQQVQGSFPPVHGSRDASNG